MARVVVHHLNDKDDDRRGGGNEVGDEYKDACPDALFDAKHKPLAHKTKAAHGHHDETWQRNAVGVAGTNGLKGLGQIAKDESQAAKPTKNLK